MHFCPLFFWFFGFFPWFLKFNMHFLPFVAFLRFLHEFWNGQRKKGRVGVYAFGINLPTQKNRIQFLSFRVLINTKIGGLAGIRHRIPRSLRQIPRSLVFSTPNPLVFHFQLVHDGHLSGRSRFNDPHEDPQKGLRPILQGNYTLLKRGKPTHFSSDWILGGRVGRPWTWLGRRIWLETDPRRRF